MTSRITLIYNPPVSHLPFRLCQRRDFITEVQTDFRANLQSRKPRSNRSPSLTSIEGIDCKECFSVPCCLDSPVIHNHDPAITASSDQPSYPLLKADDGFR